LRSYGVFKNGTLDRGLFIASLDTIVEQEMNLFIYHEVGEVLQKTFASEALQAIIGHFPGSVIEFIPRFLSDLSRWPPGKALPGDPESLGAVCRRQGVGSY
jgi:hypothetical protein